MAEISSNVTPWSENIIKTYQWLDECLQKQPSTEKEFQPAWQAYKYLLCGKMYAYIGIDDRNGRPIITLKLEPVFSDMLRSKYEDIVPGYYCLLYTSIALAIAFSNKSKIIFRSLVMPIANHKIV